MPQLPPKDFLRKIFPYIILLVFLFALVLRCWYALKQQYPGHADVAYYFTLAENLAAGRGFQVNYIWHFLSPQETIPHASNDYWMPLTSILISLFFYCFGVSVFVALIPSIICGLALTMVAYYAGKLYSSSSLVALAAGGLTLFVPPLFIFSLLTESTIYYALFAALSLLCMSKGLVRPYYFLVAGICVGLAHLTRQDGVLLCLTLVFTIFLAPETLARKLRWLFLSLALYLLVLSPLLIHNYRTFGALLPTGPPKTLFLTNYEDLYAYTKELSLKSYLEWGIQNILRSKMEAGINNVAILYGYLGMLLWFFILVEIFEKAGRSSMQPRHLYFAPLFYLGLLFIFYSLLASFPALRGGFMRSAMSVIPFLLVFSLKALDRHIPVKKIVTLLALIIAGAFFFRSVTSVKQGIAQINSKGLALENLKTVLADKRIQSMVTPNRKNRIMTYSPWEVYNVTRYETVQIPNENIEVILQAAEKFKVSFLLLPAPRPALMGIYRNPDSDPRFELLAEIPYSDMKLFLIKTASP